MSNWRLIPLGQPESQCRIGLRVSPLKGWEAGLFLQLLPVLGSGLPQGNHSQPLAASNTSSGQRAPSGNADPGRQKSSGSAFEELRQRDKSGALTASALGLPQLGEHMKPW